ncbi:MAG: serine/threonine transporter SstT [Victivallales bacterium]|nr:serine/threonine transporter SstT [Victivallales bacterium]
MISFIGRWNQLSLVKRIILGLIFGTVLAFTAPETFSFVPILGTLFVGMLKAIAPILVFFLVISAISQHKSGERTNMTSIIILYVLGTFFSGATGVIASFIFKIKLQLGESIGGATAPSGISEVLKSVILKIADNPLDAIVNANYVAVLFWAILMGLALKAGSENTRIVFANISDAISKVVKWIINLAPFGVMGLVFNSIAAQGIGALLGYGKLVLLLIGCMTFVALVVNPFIVFIAIRQNPYLLVFRCLKESGITAFFTRSSAANIPVNMNLCERLGLDKDTYSVSIPLGATINMAGAAVSISVLSLSAAFTMGIHIDFPTAVILSLLAAVSACGASGVAGGSLLLIPLACSLFGVPNDIAMQVVGIGFIIGVIQDSCETGLNSSTDVLFTATAEYRGWRKMGKLIPKKFRFETEALNYKK